MMCAKCGKLPATADGVCCELCLWLHKKNVNTIGSCVTMSELKRKFFSPRGTVESFFAGHTKKVGAVTVVPLSECYAMLKDGELDKLNIRKES